MSLCRQEHLWRPFPWWELQAEALRPWLAQHGQRRQRHQRLPVLHHHSPNALVGRQTRCVWQNPGGHGEYLHFVLFHIYLTDLYIKKCFTAMIFENFPLSWRMWWERSREQRRMGGINLSRTSLSTTAARLKWKSLLQLLKSNLSLREQQDSGFKGIEFGATRDLVERVCVCMCFLVLRPLAGPSHTSPDPQSGTSWVQF